MKIIKYSLFLITLLITQIGNAQSINTGEIVNLNSEEFSEWTKQVDVSFLETNNINIKEIINMRFALKKHSNDQSILITTDLYLKGTKKGDQLIIKDYFNDLFGWIQGRELLIIRLFEMKIAKIESYSKTDIPDVTYADLIKKSEKLELELLCIKSEASIKLGNSLLRKNKIKEAEEYFVKVLAYPWYTLDDAQIMRKLANLYVEAGKGIIECRKDNYESLRRTFFIPATQSILNPIKERALKKVEPKKK